MRGRYFQAVLTRLLDTPENPLRCGLRKKRKRVIRRISDIYSLLADDNLDVFLPPQLPLYGPLDKAELRFMPLVSFLK